MDGPGPFVGCANAIESGVTASATRERIARLFRHGRGVDARPLIVYGAGGHGKVVANILIACGETVTGFVDDTKSESMKVLGLPVLGSSDWLDVNPDARVALGVGNSIVRARTAELCLAKQAELVTVIHPSAVVAPSAIVEDGAVIMPLAVVNPDGVVGRGAIVNTSAVIEHDCVVGAFAHISPHATLGGNCAVGPFAQLGIGATMLPGTKIGEYSVVGGGGLVAHDIPPHTIAVGIPARPTRSTDARINNGRETRVSVTARLLTADDPWWPRVLAETEHDIYHRPEYACADADTDEQPLAVWLEVAGCGLLVPLLRRPVPGRGDLFDAISPYGYSGALWRRNELPAPEQRREVAGAFLEVLAAESIVTFLMRLHPLLNASTLPLNEFGLLVDHGETVPIDLDGDLTTIRARMRQTHRNEIAQAVRKGVMVEHDPTCKNLDDFIALYDATMHRVGALSAYRFDRAYFEKLREDLSDNCHLFLARTREGELAAASMFFEESGIVQYHLSAMDQAHASTHATKLMIAEAIEWAHARRHRWLHLGGGVGARADGVFKFKAGFSPLRWKFRTLRVIANETQYRELSGLTNDDPIPAATDFFPIYRRSVSMSFPEW
ncbi:NeuD/PglB/VioB family sugar acetyltransferase [Mycobacterium sp. URHB0044]|jgi:sugar O-acyltransferase (sialic acid O-acetyltransferase NeuD family)|uniref:NeuD/PglB/VioB family sugar acetyltransferase n=1 Tax=Mycobacterium sp. URHB0044 TaxID=1380386 RepID=UPI0006870E8E|nr:NeuD/PglB/VioB family sugar acetyltransferase [Mycobacterium sp. URHB0044]